MERNQDSKCKGCGTVEEKDFDAEDAVYCVPCEDINTEMKRDHEREAAGE